MIIYIKQREEPETYILEATSSLQGFKNLFTKIMIDKSLRIDAREHQHNNLKEWRKPPKMTVKDWYNQV